MILTNFSAVLDFVKLVGMVLLIEKLSRKNVSQEAKTLICFILLAVAFLSEVNCSRIESIENGLNTLRSRSLLADKNDQNFMAPLKNLFFDAILFKGAVSIATVSANYLSFSE